MTELKVVVILRDTRCFIGVQAPDCDPVFTTLEGDLGAALETVPALVQQAQEKWAESARYPKADLPEPPPRPAPSPQPPRSAPAQTPQQRMF